MGRVFVTGDTHGVLDLAKIRFFSLDEGKQLNKDDVLIIAGDFGAIWDNKPNHVENRTLSFYESMPFSIVFIDGNHENHNRLEMLPTANRFGADVGIISENVFHLRRGRVYTINEKKFWVMGGGYSIDKARRQLNISWWTQEQPSEAEKEFGLEILEENNWKVDYIVTHTCPRTAFKALMDDESVEIGAYLRMKDAVEEHNLQTYLDEVMNKTTFKKWFFGHFHEDVKLLENKVQCLYNTIEEVE